MAEIKNLKKAAKRITKAVKDKEKIILYGDADLDGVASTVILKESIQNLGGQVSAVFFPDREYDGYGITEKALNTLKDIAPSLLISLDLGIGNFEEVKLAKKKGFEIIIIDHHQVLGRLPEASVVVDPKQKGDKYPFKGLATAGIAFKLSQILLGGNLSKNLKNSFLELTALATLADLMPQAEDNKIFIEEGLSTLSNTFRPGLRAFLDILGDSRSNLQKIISALNTCEIIDNINQTYLLLTSASLKETKNIAQNLIDKAEKKRFQVKEIVRAVERKIASKLSEPIIFEGDSSWPLILAGSVASILCQKYERPVFIFKKGDSDSYGSVRAPKGLNSVDAMDSCKELLITYGGHPPASGFRIKIGNLEKFRNCLTKYFEKK
ncbi:DHH family phosphoesterase [Patescibacteria group bacterium]|nr:DHH family phosphoesterase [Patescibacteria group bacterium]